MLSVEQIFYRPKEKQAQADMKKAKFFQVHTVGKWPLRSVYGDRECC
jgi:hypothetical protein